jgi:AraC-like DNA-binding protein
MDDNVFQKTANREIPHRGVLRPRDFSSDFTFEHFTPPLNLSTYVEYLWIIRWNFNDDKVHESPTVLASPQINLYFAKKEAGIQGIFKTNKTYQAVRTGCVAGVTFKPGGFFAFWPYDISKLTDRNMTLTTIFPEVTSEFISSIQNENNEQIQERLWQLLNAKHPQPDRNSLLVQEILLYMENASEALTIESVARSFHKSERSLQLLFQKYVGVGIKWVLLRNRLLDAVDHVRRDATIDWVRISADLGYSSQAHFITDFKKVTGMTPTVYVAIQ